MKREIISEEEVLMSRWFLKASGLALVFAALPLPAPKARPQRDNVKTEQQNQEEAKTRSRLRKTHFENGNQAMRRPSDRNFKPRQTAKGPECLPI
jgi:hypothetical protein